MALSPDGERVVTATNLKIGQVWDVATGEPIGRSLRHEDRIFCAAFSPDGRRVVTGSGNTALDITWAAATNTAQIWDAATGAPIGRPMRHEDRVSSAAFSPDGARVVTASWDNTARVWEAATLARRSANLCGMRGRSAMRRSALMVRWVLTDVERQDRAGVGCGDRGAESADP